MGESSVKIKIGNRVYPLTVDDAEVDNAQQAAAIVNKNIDKLRADFAINDWVDLLAMTAFELANKKISGSEQVFIEKDNSKEIMQLDGLSEKIGELIKSEESFLT